MKYWVITLPLYGIFLAAGLGTPALVIWKREPLQFLDIMIYLGGAVAMVLATLVLALMVSWIFFPNYWWMGQVEGKDVFEFDGIYFIGLRLGRVPGQAPGRVPNRVQRILFGVDDQMRTWDLVFGMIFLALLSVHTMGFLTATRALDQYLPNPARFTETLHYPLLSSMPVMRQMNQPWSDNRALAKKFSQSQQEVETQGVKSIGQRFKLAQLYLLQAFTRRRSASDPYYITPGEQVYFDRGLGARAVSHLEALLSQPDSVRAGWNGGILALIGFFHLSDRNYGQAIETLEQAAARMGESEASQFSRYQVLLMASLALAMTGDVDRADQLLNAVLANDRLSRQAHALALEHQGDLRRLAGEYDKAVELMDKALDLYKADQDRSGVARIHLRRAALALDRGDPAAASREMSIASSLAQGLGDGFTMNMVQRLALAFSG